MHKKVERVVVGMHKCSNMTNVAHRLVEDDLW